MEELIFFAVIILFSILESIARRRKKQSGAGLPEPPDEWAPEESEAPGRAGTATSDAGASYDLETGSAADSGETLPRYSRPYGTTERRDVPRRAGSEAMIPADIWEEITGLARGRMRQVETRSEPPPPAPATPPARPTRADRGPRTPKLGQQHRVHRAHAEYGTDPSARARSEQDGLDPLSRRLSADVRAVRAQLHFGRHALRQAVILQEVLGPPAAMRPESLPE